MRTSKEEASGSTEPGNNSTKRNLPVLDLTSVVKGELGKLIREAENNIIGCTSENGLHVRIDVEKLARYLALHLIPVIMDRVWDEALFHYLLSVLRLLHSLCDLAPFHPKIEQILLDDVKVSEQLIDLIFYLLTILAACKQEYNASNDVVHLHSALVASTLSLLTGCISSQLPELAQVLLACDKVDVFMDVAFAAVHIDVKFLQTRLVAENADFCRNSCCTAEEKLNHLCQQCKASLHFLQSLCQQKLFRERLLKNKVLELLKKIFGRDPKQQITLSTKMYPKGQLHLNAMRPADIFSDDSNFRAYIIIYFTEVLTAIFSLPHGEFLSSWCSSELPVWEEDTTLEYDPCAAAGWALDLFSSSETPLNPTNIESIFIPCNIVRASYAHQRTSLLVKVVANLHCFVPGICKEEKDLFLNKFCKCFQKELPKLSDGFSAASDAEKAAVVSRNLSSLLGHAESLIPGFLNEEDVQLLRVFISQLESLIKPADVDEESSLVIVKLSICANSNVIKSWCQGNLGSKSEGFLLGHKLSRVDISENHQEVQSKGECSSPKFEVAPDLDQSNFISNSIDQSLEMGLKGWRTDKSKDNGDDARDARETQKQNMQIVETSGSDSSSIRGKNPVDQMDDVEPAKESGLAEVQRDEKVETVQYEEKHQRKRKRTIMNDIQIAIIEKALMDEPDMHRNATSLLLWADKLSAHVSNMHLLVLT